MLVRRKLRKLWKIEQQKHGYTHRTVNHSQELVNEQGDSTNKMEGHWR